LPKRIKEITPYRARRAIGQALAYSKDRVKMSRLSPAVAIALAALVLLTSGCISEDEAPTSKVKIELMGEDEQSVVQGNNTTFLFTIENNWKENTTLEMSIKDLPDDWDHDFLNDSVVLKKFDGTGVILNLSVPTDATENFYWMEVRVKAQGSSIHKDSVDIRVSVFQSSVPLGLTIVELEKATYFNFTGFRVRDGAVFDTNIEDVGENAYIKKVENYQGRGVWEPQPFRPGRHELIPGGGFDEGVLGMRKGETRAFFIEESKAFSHYKEQTINRTDRISLVEEWTSQEFFRAFRQEPALHMVITHRKWDWTVQVVHIDYDDPEEMVTLEHQPIIGKTYDPYGWDTVVESIDSSANGGQGEIVLTHLVEDLEVGDEAKFYNKSAPEEFDNATILVLTDDHVTLRVQTFHHPLAAEHLMFVVKVEDFIE
jgi:FKBP-type peptidyl-prolyl cis-trans isomerase 2